jgi:phenylacetate-CoA ligase
MRSRSGWRPGVPGEKLLVTVLFSRTQPLIRYELSDSLMPTDWLRCPCGRPFALIEGIQGRVEEALSFPARSGGQVTVQPAVVHGVMDGVPAGGWQLVQEPERLAVLLADVPDSFDEDGLADRLRRELRSRGALPPRVQVQRVRVMPAPRWARPRSSSEAPDDQREGGAWLTPGRRVNWARPTAPLTARITVTWSA